MGNDERVVSRSTSITNMILWLSAGILAAAWGSTIDPSWQPIWMRLGAFGLVSAIGLRVEATLRETRQLQAEKRNIEKTLNKRVEAIVKHEECFSPVGAHLASTHKEFS
jgi:hypothetical protein